MNLDKPLMLIAAQPLMKNTATAQQPRKPTKTELQHLIEYEARRSGYASDPNENKREAAFVVSMAYVAVFDDYVTGSPGWSGKIMLVVWDGGPDQYELFIWERGQLFRVVQEQPSALATAPITVATSTKVS